MDGKVFVWDVVSGRAEVVSSQAPVASMDLAFSPDGRRLAVASRQLTKVLDAATGDELLVLRGKMQAQLNNAGFNPRVRFSPDGQRLLSICHDSEAGLSEWSSELEPPEEHLRHAERRAVVWRLTMTAYESGGLQSPLFRRDYARLCQARLSGVWEHLARSHLHAVSGHGDAANGDLDEAVRLAGDRANALAACGDGLAARGRWEEAAAVFEKVLALDADHFSARCGAADICLRQGNRKGHEAHCRELLRRFGDTEDPLTAKELVHRFLLVPVLATDTMQVPRLTERAARVGTRLQDQAGLLDMQGCIDLRSGRFARAVERLVQAAPRFATKNAARAGYLCFLAMAQHHLHHAEEVRARLAEAHAILQGLRPAGSAREVGDYWSELIHAEAAAAEADALITGK
jgi:tetratricopeptide (TPR) repeat protein